MLLDGSGTEVASSKQEKHITASHPMYASTKADLQEANVARAVQENAGKTAVPAETHLIEWDGPTDPENPRNWSPRKRWGLVMMNSAITFCQYESIDDLFPRVGTTLTNVQQRAISSTLFAPAAHQAMADFDSHNAVLAQLLVSVYVIGLAVGPLLLFPLSELYGRKPIMHGTNATFLVAAVLAAASQDIVMLIVFRLVMGIATISMGGALVADMIEPEDRGRAMNVWNLGPVMAPIVGPIVGGYLSLATSWRWTYGLVSITGFIWLLACFALLPETYAPRIIELKVARLRESTGNPSLRSVYDGPDLPRHTISQSLARPWLMLVHSPVVVLVSLFGAIGYSYMYFMFSTFTEVFQDAYGFNAGEAGLAYLGLGIGSLSAQVVIDVFGRRQTKQREATHQSMEPEHHLPLLMYAAGLIAAGQVSYGWLLEHRVHWALPIFATGVSGFGFVMVFQAVAAYLVQAYTLYAGSAIALSMLIRCVFGLTLPLAGPRLYQELGYGWGNSLLAFVALGIVPASLWLLRHSRRLRSRFSFGVNTTYS